MFWYVYVLYNKSIKKFYTGFTGDLERRLKEHEVGITRSTRRSGWNLVYFEASLSKKDAISRERQLKTGFGRGYLKRRISDFLR